MAFSTYLADSLAAWLDDSATPFPAAPSTVYLALHTAEPDPTTGSGELVGAGYARVPISLSSAAGVGQTEITNAAPVVFGVASATLPPITHWSLWDGNAGGNMLLFGEFAASANWISGAALVVPLNQLTAGLKTSIVTIAP